MRATANDAAKKSKTKHLPPGRVKIMQALKLLLEEKEFSAVTTAEIARQQAGFAASGIERVPGAIPGPGGK